MGNLVRSSSISILSVKVWCKTIRFPINYSIKLDLIFTTSKPRLTGIFDFYCTVVVSGQGDVFQGFKITVLFVSLNSTIGYHSRFSNDFLSFDSSFLHFCFLQYRDWMKYRNSIDSRFNSTPTTRSELLWNVWVKLTGSAP